MRITLDIEDELFAEAPRITGLADESVLVREGLKALVERESSHRLARLGGSETKLKPVPRRRPKSV